MAKPSSFFTNLCTTHQKARQFQNSKTPFHNRNLSITGKDGGGGGGSEGGLKNPAQSNIGSFVDLAKDVAKVIRTRPRWEKTLLSDFPSVDFADSRLYCEVLKVQNNALLSLRFYNWLNLQNGFVPDQFSSEVVFSGLVEANAAYAAKSFRESTKIAVRPSCLEAYIECLCENGLIEDALNVFDELKGVGHCPALKTWNSAFSGLIRLGKTDIFWKLYEDMMEYGVVADVDTIGYLIQAFCIENNVSKGYELLRQVLEAGHAPSNVAFNKLIYESCKSRDYFRVSALLHGMIANNCSLDISTYQEVIHGLCENGMRREAFRIFNDIKERGYAPDRVMYTTMIHGLCKMKWLGDARKLWFEMIHKGFVPNEFTYNALINGFLRTNNLDEAERLYKEMRDKGYGETTITYNTMINGLCHHGRVREADVLFKKMTEKGVYRDVITYNSLIQGFCKLGNITEGLNILNELLKEGLQPTSASYSKLIEKLCEYGRVEEAKSLWNDMQDRGIKPAASTYDSIILGLSKQGYITEGIDWLISMIKSRLRPQKKTFEEVIYGLSQADKMGDALFLLDYMLRLGYAVNEYMFQSLVDKLCKDNSHHVETQMGNIIVAN